RRDVRSAVAVEQRCERRHRLLRWRGDRFSAPVGLGRDCPRRLGLAAQSLRHAQTARAYPGLGAPMTVTATRLLDNYISGQWTPARDPTGVLDVRNPATGEVLARVPLSGASDLDCAVARSEEHTSE